MSLLQLTGLFDFVTPCDKASLEYAHSAISECELWDWIRDFKDEKGFMFSDSDELNRITTHMKDVGLHSGASFARVMHLMQYIAQHGFEKFKAEYIRQHA